VDEDGDIGEKSKGRHAEDSVTGGGEEGDAGSVEAGEREGEGVKEVVWGVGRGDEDVGGFAEGGDAENVVVETLGGEYGEHLVAGEVVETERRRSAEGEEGA
jgi:hypothetical protein